MSLRRFLAIQELQICPVRGVACLSKMITNEEKNLCNLVTISGAASIT